MLIFGGSYFILGLSYQQVFLKQLFDRCKRLCACRDLCFIEYVCFLIKAQVLIQAKGK